MLRTTDSVQVGNLTLPNRLVFPPMATWKAENGVITEEQRVHYRERAGRIGLITTEYAFVSEEGQATHGQLSIANDSMLDGMKKLVEEIHARGNTKVFSQIHHAGEKSSVGPYILGDQGDINRIVEKFALAAARSKAAGYDGTEIHAAHGYLLNSLYSPLSNERSDAYNGWTLEGRTKMILEVIRAVRQTVGDDYPLSIRFGGCDFMNGGSTIDEARIAAKWFEDAGVDMISISGGLCEFKIPGVKIAGWFQNLSAAVRESVTIPVLLTGGIRTRIDAESLLNAGKADLIGIGRPIYKNPNFIDDFWL